MMSKDEMLSKPWMLPLMMVMVFGGGGGVGFSGSTLAQNSQAAKNEAEISVIDARLDKQEIAQAGMVSEITAATEAITEISMVLKEVAKSHIEDRMALVELRAEVESIADVQERLNGE